MVVFINTMVSTVGQASANASLGMCPVVMPRGGPARLSWGG
jgi:hypothetical protein